MEELDQIKLIAKELLKGKAFVAYKDNYHFINQVINRKRGVISKLEVELYKNTGIMELADVQVMYDFCYQLREAYVLDFQIIFKNEKGGTDVIAKLNLGVEKNTDQMKMGDVAKGFQNNMQKLVDKNESGITKISMKVGDNPEVTIAERKGE